MEQRMKERSLRPRIGLALGQTEPVTVAGFSTQEIEGLADSLVEQVFVYGDDARIKDRLQEILALGIDELVVSLSELADRVQERVHLIRLIGQL
ncbi:MAG: hypothetical protein HYR94_19295 [Chloroflexi bacterium]|nr:hypothetical protein [Chloroflexota bacterium]